MPEVITEAELRELWQNGRGKLPPFPPGTRFSPAGRDFLHDQRIEPEFSADAGVFNPQHPLGARPVILPARHLPVRPDPAGRRQDAEPRRKTIYTEQDVDDLVQAGTTSLTIDDTVVLTELAQERAMRLGIKLVRQKGLPASSAVPISHNLARLVAPPQVTPEREPTVGKTFYTDVDIENLHRTGARRLEVNDQVVLTELAREKARQLGVELVAGAVPVPARPAGRSDDALVQQVKTAVMARLSGEVDERVVEAVIRKVLAAMS